MWIKVVDGIDARCLTNKSSNKAFKYQFRQDDDVKIIESTNNSPTELTHRSKFYKKLSDILKEKVPAPQVEETLLNILNQLEENIVDEDKIKENEAQVKLREESKRIERKYIDLYTDFNSFLEKYDKTPLELIVATSHCLGVGSPREIVRAFLGYFQTVVGLKASNVIAIGSPASGKSFVLETTLDMIPDEYVHYGVKSVAYFFRKYNHKDLTGHIFYLGDLGGSKDSEDTIRLRDLIKQLNTDGYVERGVIDKDNNMEEEEQWVKGYACVSYTSALEEMVNDQEKSRGVLLTPLPVDSGKLVVFLSTMENRGKYYDDIEELFEIRDSIKGLVYNFNPDAYDFFNPYIFSVESLIKENDDFNRKVQEYNAILKLVTILNHPTRIKHQMYLDENYEKKDTDIILASKRDNITALNIFNSANLLPDEIRFANGLIKEYDEYPISIRDESKLWEDEVYEDLVRQTKDLEENDPNVTHVPINLDDKRININYEDNGLFLFTLKSLKSSHRGKTWFKKSKNYLNDRIKTLLDENIIVNVGKDTKNNHNVYCLNYGLGDSVEDTLPQFKVQDIKKATNLFRATYPEQIDEYLEFLANDTDDETASIFETVSPIKPNLPYLEGQYGNL